MRIFLAGASGVVGRRIIRLLVESGHLVTGLTRRPSAAAVIEEVGGRVVVADVYDADAIGAAVRAAKPDVPTDEGATWARGADNRYARTQLNWTPRWTTWRDGFAHMAHVPRLPRGPGSLD
jgi:uncharacterized protein YbjT (DUF2867 family)